MTRFLYVEDDRFSRDVFLILLTRALGYDRECITIFEDSTDFMPRLRALPEIPDIIFLDVHMSPHNGFDLLKMVRDEPAYDKVHIIAMTAGVMATDIEMLQKAGFDGLIGKPVRKAAFPDLLRRILAGESVWFTT